MTVVRIPEPSLVRPGSFVINPSSPESLGPMLGVFAISQSTAYQTGSRCIFVPFTIEKMAVAYQMFTHNGNTAGNNIDVGIYDRTLNSLVTKGSTAQAGTSNLQLFDITDTILLPGRYFMGLSMDGGVSPTGTFSRWSAQPRHLRLMGCLEKLSTFPLPTGAVTPTTVSDGYLPHFGVVLATVA